MSQENTVEESPTLGTFLRNHREQRGVSLDEATEVTKISKRVLEAIESDAYDSLPAETFSRGFYSMYATFLGLDSAEILARYLESRKQQPLSRRGQAKVSLKSSNQFSTFSEPASFSSASAMSFIAIAILIAIAAICWSLGWNPATYISARLQSLKTVSLPGQEQVTESTPWEDTSAKNAQPVAPALAPELPKVQFNLAPTSETTEQSVTSKPSPPPALYYVIEARFNNGGNLQITLDDGAVLEKSFTAGETLQWEAKNKIFLVLPEEISGSLLLNGIEIPLPEAKDGQRRLTLPEDLLD
ncbi:MAG: helix-turn-helix domain-containing protein [Proteobacteria bacterium]|nr:helix-turn-helix domain-containing protein [Pseudomonadota bacterium]MBU1233434.1 helix-turn-helix domain-containing protein [Pseudomonadota bacterium]MBU1420083.1 helix-turn-helix domain-containing protein [Pseudomonadota bacterium]MBU1454554.1 helix-turn-helix domain-containing protein [Pseudomonadota bacterium]